MRHFLIILALAAVLALIAVIAVAMLFSINAGRPAWILSSILVLDSVGILVIGACIIHNQRRHRRRVGRGNAGRRG